MTHDKTADKVNVYLIVVEGEEHIFIGDFNEDAIRSQHGKIMGKIKNTACLRDINIGRMCDYKIEEIAREIEDARNYAALSKRLIETQTFYRENRDNALDIVAVKQQIEDAETYASEFENALIRIKQASYRSGDCWKK